MTFTFNNAIPASGNNPSVDQPGMLTNNISTANIINVDHRGFNQTSGGKHKVIRALSLQTLGIALPGGVAGEGTIYTKTASSVTNLFYRPDATSDEYQLTRTNSSKIALLGTDTNYVFPTPPVTTLGGWTFLPGGMILQYGTIVPTNTPGFTTVAYPVSFSTPAFSIQITPTTTSSAGDQTASLRVGSSGNTSFQINTSSSGNVVLFNWMAIGI